MIPFPGGARVWIALGQTDVRRGMDALVRQAQHGLQRDPHCGALYLFRGRQGDLIKIFLADGVGLSLYIKRLERGRFIWPLAKGGVVAISPSQWARLWIMPPA